MGYAKNHPLQDDGDPDAAGESVELLLEISTEGNFFTEAGNMDTTFRGEAMR